MVGKKEREVGKDGASAGGEKVNAQSMDQAWAVWIKVVGSIPSLP